MTKAKLTRIPKRVLACVLAVLMVLSCLTMLPFTSFAADLNHASLESPAVVQDGGTYYAFGNDGVVYKSSDMASWNELYGGEKAYGYLDDGAFAYISNSLFGDSDLQQSALDSPEVVNINGEWYLYLSIMNGSRSMIVVGTSNNIEGPYSNFQKVLETGFNRGDATDVLQSYFGQSYSNNMPPAVKDWGKGTCYYYSNFLGLNYQWFTEELPRAYAPSIAQDDEGNYWMAYGYRNGGIWLQKLHKDGENAGLVDFTWSGNNWNEACEGDSAEEKRDSENHYLPEKHYDTKNVSTHRLDPYFGELVVHTTEGGDTDTLESTVSRAGEEPELYFVNGTAYLQVTYGGAGNGDGYNVRSYKNSGITLNNVNVFDFVDMNSESGVDNADASMIASEDVKRTGLKLMGDYNLPGTASATYYTSPGASSVSTGENGLTFYNYQVKFNNATNGNPASDTGTEMRSHILLHNVNGDPLVTPFEYTGDTDKDLYDAAATEYDVNDQIVGQYYVVSSGGETSTSKESVGGVTLTAGGLVMGMISGTWEFETIGNYQNGVVIHDQVNDVDYHGAFLMQTVEDSTSIDSGAKTALTFTLVGNNQTVWGVWYDNYEPGGENNADANLSISPAIYTGGALDLNARQIGQLGLKWGNYITALKFADIDYSTYLTIDSNFEITEVRDEDDNDGVNGIGVAKVTLNSIDSIVNTMYVDRALDTEEAGKSGADNGDFNGDANGESASLLRQALTDKLAKVPAGQDLYVLTGYLDSGLYGREAYTVNDKGDISLRVSYTDTETDTEFSERVYSHVYQQPVPANLSAGVYYDNGWNSGASVNATFIRAEGSYAKDSVFPGTNTVRNDNMRDNTTKYFAAVPTFGYYNNTLYTDHSNFGADGATQEFFHNNLLPSVDYDDMKFNQSYRTTYSGTDIVVSYEQMFNDDGDSHYDYSLAAGPRAEYYIDLSSADTSNIAGYYDADTQQYTIPLYYSSLYNVSNFDDDRKTFNYYTDANSTTYSAGLYPDYEYTMADNDDDRTGPRNGAVYNPDNSNYVFKANFDDVEYMYDGNNSNHNDGGTELVSGGLLWSDYSYSANIWITADKNLLVNNTEQNYNASDVDDYNFYVRTRSDTVAGADGNNNSHLRLVQDMEYGIYISNKKFLRDYYNQVMEDKIAQNYTYYSWEQFREATRLINDYLNNYMQLADSYTNYGAAGYSDEDFAGDDAEFQQWFTSNNTTAAEVMTSESLLNSMLTNYSYKVQNVLCYLLTAAEDELFSYQTYNDFMTAYEKWELAFNQREDYTTSSWMAYMQFKDVSLNENITMQDLVAYTSNSNDSDTDPETEIYNPSSDASQEGKNHSWKIIYNEYLGGDARELFETATDILNHATSVLRHKADYTDLDEQMTIANTKYDNGDTDRQSLTGSAAEGTLNGEAPEFGNSTEGERSTSIFDIDRSTVNAIATSNEQNQGAGHDRINGEQYTVSSLAAFDKIYDAIWEIKGDTTTTSTDNNYLDDVSVAGAALTDRTDRVDETGESTDKWYSDLVRDDQQRYLPAHPEGEDTNRLSTVQQKINDRVTWVQRALEWLEPVALEDQYQTFDYLIDVISTIDFNAYTPEGQQLLWDKLYELLVEGGVYAVNQQLFSKNSMLENKLDPTDPLTQILYNNGQGEDTYYTGWNATNVDAATTELMELLTTLDTAVGSDGETPLYKKNFDINVNVSVYNEDGTPYITPTISDTIHYAYGDPVTVDVTKYTEQLGSQYATYDPAHMYIHSWSIESSSGTQYLHNTGNVLEFTASEAATVNVAVSLMPTPSDEVPENTVNVTVNSMIAHADRVDLAMNLSESELRNYKITVADDDTLTITGPNSFSKTFTPYKVSFYEFAGWRYNGLYDLFQVGQEYCLADYVRDGKVTISPYYKVQGLDVEITVNGKAVDNLQYRKFDSLVEFGASEFDTDLGGKFAAWLLKDTDASGEWDGTYTIASYDQEFSFYASDDEAYVQANKLTAEDGSFYYVVSGDEAKYDENSQYNPADESEDAIKEIDTKSLYYRLSNGLRDAWSHISEYDLESETVSLYSHFTSSETVPENAKVIETGGLFVYVNGDPSSKLDVFDDRLVVGANGINQFIATQNSSSGQSEGQYVVSVVIPDERQDMGLYALMRNYVRYSYELEDPTTGEKKTFYSYAYSDLQYTPVGVG